MKCKQESNCISWLAGPGDGKAVKGANEKGQR